jgi:hypothetical protein
MHSSELKEFLIVEATAQLAASARVLQLAYYLDWQTRSRVRLNCWPTSSACGGIHADAGACAAPAPGEG